MQYIVFLFLASLSLSTYAQTYTAKVSSELKRTGDLANDSKYIGVTAKGFYVQFTPFTSKAEVVQYSMDYKEIRRFDADKKENGAQIFYTKIIQVKGHTYVLYTETAKAENKTTVYTQELDKNDAPMGGLNKLLSFDGIAPLSYWFAINKGLFLSKDSNTLAFVYDAPAPKGETAVKVVTYNADLKKQWEQPVTIAKGGGIESVLVENDGRVALVSSVNIKNRHSKDSGYEYWAYVANEAESKEINCDFSESIAPRDVDVLGLEGDEIVLNILINKRWNTGTGIYIARANIKTGKLIADNTYLLKASDIMDEKKAAGSKGPAELRYMSVYKTLKLSDGTYAVATGYNFSGYGGQETLFLIDKELKVKAVRVPGETMVSSQGTYAIGDKVYWIQTDQVQNITMHSITSAGKLQTGYAELPVLRMGIDFTAQIDDSHIFFKLVGSNKETYRYGIVTIKP